MTKQALAELMHSVFTKDVEPIVMDQLGAGTTLAVWKLAMQSRNKVVDFLRAGTGKPGAAFVVSVKKNIVGMIACLFAFRYMIDKEEATYTPGNARGVFENEIMALREAGQKEYAHTDDNAFSNFERGSDDLGIDRKQILWVFAMKHRDGIQSHLDGHRSQRENVRGRVNDLIVYSLILYGMIEEEAA